MNVRTLISGALIAIMAVLALLSFTTSSCQRKADGAQHQADTQKGAADVHAGEGVQADAQAQKDAQAVLEARAEVARLRRELDALRAARHLPPAAPERLPVGPDPQPAPTGDNPGLVVIVAKQDELIAAQDHQIKGLEAQVVTLTLARDDYRSAFEAERKRAELLELAAKAQKQAAVAAEWKSGLKGALAGAALAYVAGRLK